MSENKLPPDADHYVIETVDLPPELAELVDAEAERRGLSRSECVSTLIAEHFQELPEPPEWFREKRAA